MPLQYLAESSAQCVSVDSPRATSACRTPPKFESAVSTASSPPLHTCLQCRHGSFSDQPAAPAIRQQRHGRFAKRRGGWRSTAWQKARGICGRRHGWSSQRWRLNDRLWRRCCTPSTVAKISRVSGGMYTGNAASGAHTLHDVRHGKAVGATAGPGLRHWLAHMVQGACTVQKYT